MLYWYTQYLCWNGYRSINAEAGACLLVVGSYVRAVGLWGHIYGWAYYERSTGYGIAADWCCGRAMPMMCTQLH